MSIISTANIQALCQLDPIFSMIIEKYGIPPNWQRPEGFETLAHIILEQQVSLESALAAYKKLKTKLGEFTPTQVLTLADAEMRTCTISRQKTRYLRLLSEAILSGGLDLEKLNQLPYEAAKAELTKIIGIGEWTAKIYLMFCLQMLDVFPEGDIAAINTIKELKNVQSKEACIQIAEAWLPYRSTATYLLWHYYLCKRGRNAVI